MADKLHKPVICEDVSHEIDTLHGFLGAYLKHVEQQIGADGFLKLLEGKERTSRFVLAVSYADPEGHSFVTSTCTDGHIGFAPEGAGHIMDTIFIPHGTNYSIAKLIEMGDFDRPHDHYDRLCTYIKSLT
jgi:inosine/xanthosine triphosphate pyrophosphatase family protein